MRTDLLVNEFVYKAMTDKYITVFEKNFKRNFIHIQDVANVFHFAIENYDKMKKNVYNVGLSNANLSKEELLEKIKEFVMCASMYTEFKLRLTFLEKPKNNDEFKIIIRNHLINTKDRQLLTKKPVKTEFINYIDGVALVNF